MCTLMLSEGGASIACLNRTRKLGDTTIQKSLNIKLKSSPEIRDIDFDKWIEVDSKVDAERALDLGFDIDDMKPLSLLENSSTSVLLDNIESGDHVPTLNIKKL